MHPTFAAAWLPVVLLLCATLSGCGLFSSPPPPSPAPLSPVREFIVNRTPGGADATGTVSDPEFGQELRITLEQEFLAASGETCRRASLASPGGEVEMVVMCRNSQGVWTMAPRVWGQGLSALAGTAEPPKKPARPADDAKKDAPAGATRTEAVTTGAAGAESAPEVSSHTPDADAAHTPAVVSEPTPTAVSASEPAAVPGAAAVPSAGPAAAPEGQAPVAQ